MHQENVIYVRNEKNKLVLQDLIKMKWDVWILTELKHKKRKKNQQKYKQTKRNNIS